jgi:peptide/nickel transport system ATP-binding protein
VPKQPSKYLLSVQGLSTCIASADENYTVVDDVSFELERGKTLALLGESGCGKSMTALSIMGLLPKPAGHAVAGKIQLDDDDLLLYSEQQMRSIRGKRIGMIFQEPMTSLNPVLTVGEQIIEVLQLHVGLRGRKARERVLELLQQVRVSDAEHRIDSYPHQLSGGMKQRIMVALALAAEPDLLIADEPTTALDVTTQAQVLLLIKSLQKTHNMAILLITHDLGIVAQMADDVAVMYAGELVEVCSKKSFFDAPQHPYSRALFDALPDINKRNHALAVIKGQVPQLNQTFSGCRYLNRCDLATHECAQQPIQLLSNAQGQVRCINYQTIPATQAIRAFTETHNASSSPILEIKDLKVHFPIRKGLFKRTVGYVYAVDGVSIEIEKGKTVALVGESGCGKTTVGKSILNLIPSSSGSVMYSGKDLLQLSSSHMKPLRSKLQFVFQDPFSSMNPRMLVADILAEGLVAQKMPQQDIQTRCLELLAMVGLDESALSRYPHEFSGGQRQRISIARALAVNPEFIVCDEPTSALDVSVQAQILNLLRDLQNKLGLSYLFITHNISVVSYLAQQVAVMYLGRIVERGSVQQIMTNARHPYTQALLSAVPDINQHHQEQIVLEGELPSAINPPSGCYFHQRCPEVMPQCREAYPPVMDDEGHAVSCFLYSTESGQAL